MAWYNWGNDLLRSGDFPTAARVITRSLHLYPTDVWALNNRGVAHEMIGNMGKARRDSENALSIEPGFEQAKENLRAMDADGDPPP